MIIAAVFYFPAALKTHAQTPETGKAARYCNPLPMVTGQGGNASGDVTVIRENGRYYMFCTGGGAWISDDMLNWSFQRVENVPVAPDVVKYNGSFYMCGNDGPLFKADNPLGPYTKLGDWPRNAPLGILEFTVFGKPSGYLPAAVPIPLSRQSK